MDYANPSQHFSKKPIFWGTDNPRYLRVLDALIQRPRLREEIDDIAGCSNGPALISALRDLGLAGFLLCERIRFIDRDGKPCRPGVYSLTEAGRRLVRAWSARIRKASAVNQQANLELFNG